MNKLLIGGLVIMMVVSGVIMGCKTPNDPGNNGNGGENEITKGICEEDIELTLSPPEVGDTEPEQFIIIPKFPGVENASDILMVRLLEDDHQKLYTLLEVTPESERERIVLLFSNYEKTKFRLISTPAYHSLEPRPTRIDIKIRIKYEWDKQPALGNS